MSDKSLVFQSSPSSLPTTTVVNTIIIKMFFVFLYLFVPLNVRVWLCVWITGNRIWVCQKLLHDKFQCLSSVSSAAAAAQQEANNKFNIRQLVCQAVYWNIIIYSHNLCHCVFIKCHFNLHAKRRRERELAGNRRTRQYVGSSQPPTLPLLYYIMSPRGQLWPIYGFIVTIVSVSTWECPFTVIFISPEPCNKNIA